MTERLYYSDAYTSRFTASVTDRLEMDGQKAVVLDKTFFYPTSGGQPADRGTVNQIPVTGVDIGDNNGQILHWIEGAFPPQDEVAAEIDWGRRFDHMQQHTGQHILSQAFITVADAETIGFHLADDNVTIDLDSEGLTAQQLDQAESLANEIIWQNRPVSIHMVSAEESGRMALRKTPPDVDGLLRLVEIEDFDLTACGGTHVRMAGEIGVIKILKLERRSQKLRVEFRCGARALADYGAKNLIVNDLASQLTTGQSAIVSSVARLQEDLKSTRRTARRQQKALLKMEAETLVRKGERLGDAVVVSLVMPDGEADGMRALGAQLAKEPGVVALLAASEPKTSLLFCKSEDAPGDMNILLQAALEQLDSAGGGGTAIMAQGGGAPADRERVARAVARAETVLREQI
jgi:alanyl-tRNA synthetase